MRDVEDRLGRDLHAALDPVDLPPSFASAAVAAGRVRLRRRRALVAGVATASVVAVLAGVVAVRPSRRASPVAPVAPGVVGVGGLRARTWTYVAALASGDVGALRRDMTPATAEQLGAARLRDGWRATTDRVGALVTARDAAQLRDRTATWVVIALVHARGESTFSVAYDPSLRVVGVFIGGVGRYPDTRLTRARILAGNVVDALAAGSYGAVRATFDPTMLRALSVAAMREAWDAYLREHGRFDSRSIAGVEDANGYQVVDVRCRFGDADGVVRVTLRPDGKVSGLYLRPLS